MHQPYYKDDLTSTYLLPWVRLRCAKDYYKMAALLDAYPGVPQTFNLVPSLLAQIEDYASGTYQDLFLNLSRKPAQELTAEEREFMLRWMRESPQFLRVQASPRYLELASREVSSSFSVGDLRDLQVWSNLSWCDPAWVDSDPMLSDLKSKDRDYSESDKEALFSAQLDMVRKVIPKYREVADRGQAELTFSPYYHPILPLISHVESARIASPQMRLPHRHFSHPEDAQRQIEMGLDSFERLLGRRPAGMWPSEMAVGESVAGLAMRTGVEWFISDEEVLARSLDVYLYRDGDGRQGRPDLLYQPHRIERDGKQMTIVFRDALLSNLIGFDYHRKPALQAAGDLVARLRAIRDHQDDRELLVTIALDGENAWEFYPRDGHDFLNALYGELEADEGLIPTTVSDFLREHPAEQALPRLHTGSWIGASLDTWIGDPEHNVAWDLLAETRDWLEEFARNSEVGSEQLAAAWREIMITEGSDWFWWFSRKHDSGMDVIWDNQFRLHLRNVYKLVGEKPPARLFQPILQRLSSPEKRQPLRDISPSRRDDPAWNDAGYFHLGSGFGALHRPVGIVERLLYGADHDNLHIRIDSPLTPDELASAGISFWIYCSGPHAHMQSGGDGAVALPLRDGAVTDLGFDPAFVIRVTPTVAGGELVVTRVRDSEAGAPGLNMALSSPLTFSVPFLALEKRGGEPMELALVVTRRQHEVEQVPPVGSLALRVPRRELEDGDRGAPLKVLIASAEVAPFAKTASVADVVGTLPKELRSLGHDVRLVLPRYRGVSPERYGLKTVVNNLAVPLGTQVVECSILEGKLGQVPVYFVDCPQFYDRDALYGFGDDDARFIYLSRALLEMLRPLDFIPDVIHLNDWHTALVPNLLNRLYADDAALRRIATVLTIHNLPFQGVFGSGTLNLANLELWGLMQVGIPHLDDVVNILGRGIHYCDLFNTVSPQYAKEIQTPEYGEGMDALIRANAHKLYGIVNGIDYDTLDPSRDPALPHHYSAADPAAKALDKAALRAELGLAEGEAPLVAVISRFYEQKGLELIEGAMPGLAGLDIQLAVLGTGERHYEDMFRYHAAHNPGRMAAYVGFDGRLAQMLYAGADILLMPSKFEPCGLGQLISLRYGTIPVVRATGGLVDTIQDYDPARETGFGFVFRQYDPWQMFGAVVRAAETYRHRAAWEGLIRRAMSEDVSWAKSARRYAQLYQTAMIGHHERHGVAAAVS